MVPIREVSCLPNASIEHIGETVAPRIGDIRAALDEDNRFVRVWMKAKVSREISIKVPIRK